MWSNHEKIDPKRYEEYGSLISSTSGLLQVKRFDISSNTLSKIILNSSIIIKTNVIEDKQSHERKYCGGQHTK